MKKKLDCILLIDDDEPTNILHQIIIDDAEVAHSVQVAESATEALDYLSKSNDGSGMMRVQHPDLIFLDINMPGMDGFEFLKKYKSLTQQHTLETVVIMLTTSLNPDDEAKARSVTEVQDYLNKPLTEDKLLDIIDRFF